MEHGSLIDYDNKYDKNEKETYLIKRVKATYRSSYPFRNYNKKMWINALAEFYFNDGYDAGRIGPIISNKTNINYPFISRYLDVKYKQKMERIDDLKIDILSFYQKTKNLKLCAEQFSTCPNTISSKLKEWGEDPGKHARHISKMKEIKKPPKKLNFLENGKVYRLQASWCDYFYHDHLGNNATVIEEKQTLSKYNFGLAATQVIVGKQIIEEMTDYEVDHMVILTHKIATTDQMRILNAIEDYTKYLDIDLVIASN